VGSAERQSAWRGVATGGEKYDSQVVSPEETEFFFVVFDSESFEFPWENELYQSDWEVLET